jgi:CheY-like chemotaxis protein
MKPIHLLLIEDNEGDILLTREAFAESRIINNMSVITDGKSAITYFEETKQTEDLPDLVLLDINLPRKSGHEVLQYIKGEERLTHIPVIMLTTSSSEKDIILSYKHHVNCYITKPIDVVDFMNAVSKIEDFWVSIVSIPPKTN